MSVSALSAPTRTIPAHAASLAEAEPSDRKARTAELIERAAQATGETRRALLDEVIVLNIPVAHALAARYRNRGQPLEELEQVACLALTKAVRAFRPDRGDDLLVFAVPSILGELKRHFRDSTWAVRPPRRLQELRARIAAAEEELAQELGHPARPADLAEALECTTEEILEAIECGGCARPDPLEEERSTDGGVTTVERLGDDDPGFAWGEAIAVLGPVCRRLKERDRAILRMRFYEQRTQQQIADELGVSQVQVSRLLQRVLADLRSAITGQPRPKAA